MSKQVYIAYIAAFALCLFSVGTIQAVWELRRGESIQMNRCCLLRRGSTHCRQTKSDKLPKR